MLSTERLKVCVIVSATRVWRCLGTYVSEKHIDVGRCEKPIDLKIQKWPSNAFYRETNHCQAFGRKCLKPFSSKSCPINVKCLFLICQLLFYCQKQMRRWYLSSVTRKYSKSSTNNQNKNISKYCNISMQRITSAFIRYINYHFTVKNKRGASWKVFSFWKFFLNFS